jgi:putative autoinducer-2 (AI-2) aldolase
MPDLTGFKVAKNFHADEPIKTSGEFYVKGANNLDWGMKRHLANIFNPKSGHTAMFAFDHGYFMGPTAGLERLDLVVPKIAPYVDVLMATRGAFRTSVDPAFNKSVALRISSGSSMLNDDLSHETLAVDIKDAIKLGADAVAVQSFIGADGQLQSIDNLSRAINLGYEYDIPTIGVVAVGKEMERTDRFFKLATRIVAELGANIVKSYYCDNFEEVVSACPVPIVVAGGKKLPEHDALELVYHVMSEGAAGVDMGRNIFQSLHPSEMAQAVAKIVHENFSDKEAIEFYEDAIHF